MELKHCGVNIPGRVKSTADQIVANIDMVGDAFKRNIKSIADAFRDVPSPVPKIKHKFAAVKERLDQMRNAAKVLRAMSKNPEFMKVLKGLGDEAANVILAALDAAQPSIDQVLDKANTMLGDAGTSLGKSLALTVSNALKPLIGAIPIVGPIVAGLTSSIEVFNKVVDTCVPPVVDKVNEIGPQINNIGDAVKTVQCATLDLVHKVQNETSKFNSAMPGLPSLPSVPSVPSLPGGLPTGLPKGLPALPGGLPTGLPAGLPAGLPGGLPAGLPKGLPAGLPSVPKLMVGGRANVRDQILLTRKRIAKLWPVVHSLHKNKRSFTKKRVMKK
jgi:phage-related protein